MKKSELPRVTKLGLREALDKVFAQAGITDLEIILPVTQAAWDYLRGGQAMFEDEPEVSKESPKVSREEMKLFISEFCRVTGLIEPIPATDKERKSVGELWWQPVRQMIKIANGSSVPTMLAAVEKMERDGLTIHGPRSILANFRDVYRRRNIVQLTPALAAVKRRRESLNNGND
jgi:hypothetical protein